MNSSEPRQLDSAQKAGFISLLIFALVTFSFSFLHLRNTVYGRFTVRQQTPDLQLGEYSETVRLQSIDTDKDTLSDYEEIYDFNTSPYLPDTDSDKRTDATEISEGTNPLCPEGQMCENEFGAGTGEENSPESPLLESAVSPSEILLQSQLGNVSGGAIDPEAVAMILRDPAQLRQLILNTGKISKEELEKIDDATLKQLAEEMITEYSALQNKSATTTDQ